MVNGDHERSAVRELAHEQFDRVSAERRAQAGIICLVYIKEEPHTNIKDLPKQLV